MNINFELYKVFYYSAKTLSFSKASKKLFVSQSSVSQSIKKLETNLGVKLFNRVGRKVKLSHEGKIFFKYIEDAFNTIKAGENQLNSLINLKKGEITIGASDTISKYYLMPFIKKFYKKYPNIKIHLSNNSSTTNAKLVRNQKVDFGVININPKLKYKNLSLRKLWSSKNIFVYSKDHFNFENEKINLNKLKNYPLLTLEKNSTTRMVLDNFLNKKNLKIDFDFEFGTTDLIIEMALAGVGIAYVSKDSVKTLIENKKLSPLDIDESLPIINIGLIINKKFPLNIAAKNFINLF